MNGLQTLNPNQIAVIRREVVEVRREIALAKSKVTGIQSAITSREKYLARLEAQLFLSPAGQPAAMSA